jgi:subtilisin family serine protease
MLKNITFYILIILLSVLFPARSIITNENVNKSRYVKDHFIVKLKNDITQITAAGLPDASDINAIKSISAGIDINILKVKKLFPPDVKNNTALSKKYGLDKFYIVFVDTKKDIKDICKEYEKNGNVDFAEPDFIGEAAGKKTYEPTKPNDEFFSRQWGLYNDGSIRTTVGKQGKSGADLNVLKGWEVETGSENVIVAIMDSGSKLDHPDLDGRFWINKGETKNGRDDDGNGFVDDVNGWNFAYENSNVKDDGGHGTNISGTIAAKTDNAIGYAGIDQHCKLMICKNLDDENLGEYSWWSASLYYAANNGAKVINMSEGGYDYSKTLNTAIDYAYDAGCLIVASMMNKNNNDKYYPACFKNVMAIGATDTDDSRCRQFTWGGGSNWGRHISVVAPGNRIYGLDYKDNYDYEVYWSGTSQATAYVSGLAALLLSQDPGRTNKDLKEIITLTAVDQVGDPREDTPGWDEYYGYGRVNVYAALMYGKTPVDKSVNKEKNNGANYDEENKRKDEIEKKDEERQGKAVERNSSDIDQEKNKEGKRARKSEH